MDLMILAIIIIAALAIGLVVNNILTQRFTDADSEHVRELAREKEKKDRERRAAEFAGKVGRSSGFARADADAYRKRLARAGVRVDPATWRGAEVLSAAAGIVLGVIFGILFGSISALFCLIAVGAALGVAAPRLFLFGRSRERAEKIEHDLPDILDLLAINVEAGSTLERGFKQIATKCEGPLAEEFGQVDRDINLFNISNVAAIERMSARSRSRQLGMFCSSLAQSLIQGATIGPALKAQADAARSAQFDALEEKSNKLAVKAIIPMAMFFLPSTLVTGAAPFVAQVIEMAQMYANI